MATRHLAPIAQYREPRDTSAAAVLVFAGFTELATGDYAFTADRAAATHVLDNPSTGVLTIAEAGSAVREPRFTRQVATYLAYGIV